MRKFLLILVIGLFGILFLCFLCNMKADNELNTWNNKIFESLKTKQKDSLIVSNLVRNFVSEKSHISIMLR